MFLEKHLLKAYLLTKLNTGAINEIMKKWLEDRLGLSALFNFFMDEPVEGGAKWSYVFGSALIFVFMMQVVSGVMLATGYSASATDAWGSVYYIQHKTFSGWFVRGMHNIGSSAMIVLAVLHMGQTLIYGAYRKPRELNWITGVFMLFMVFGFGLTGYLLPWDQKGFWATQVATSIMGLSPVIGEFLKEVVQGGNDYGNLTLTRFYSFHVFFLPAGLMSFMAIHIYLFRRHGVTPHWKPGEHELKKKTQPFWPDQLFKDVIVAVIVFISMVVLVWYRGGAELQSPADPSSNYLARPEWYFLFLFQLLKYFEGEMEVVGAIILPTIVAALIIALPFIDRAKSRYPLRRLPVMGSFGAVLACVIFLTAMSVISDSGDERIMEQREKSENRHGRCLIAVRDNDRAADAMGMHPGFTKVYAFALSGFIAGIAGALHAYLYRGVGFESFTLHHSIIYLAMAIVGGMGTLNGSFWGPVAIQGLELQVEILAEKVGQIFPSGLNLATALRPLTFGLVIVLFLMFEPRGIANWWRMTRSYFKLWPFRY